MEVRRWVVESRDWQTQEENEQYKEYLQLVNEEEEKVRIQRFYFQKDKNSALLGRLLIYKFLDFSYEFYQKTTKNAILPKLAYQIGRTSTNKPHLIQSQEKAWYSELHIDFNLSHHGKYVILVGVVMRLDLSSDFHFIYPFAIGCDLMSVEITGRDKNIPKFFSTLRDYFSPNEWQIIDRNGRNERQNLHRFFEQWALKESYVKAIGEGLNFSLTRIQFLKFEEIKSNIFRVSPSLYHYVEANDKLPLYQPVFYNINSNTVIDEGEEDEVNGEDICKIELNICVQIDDQIQDQWLFELHQIDDDHVAAVAFCPVEEVQKEYAKKAFPNSHASPTWSKHSFPISHQPFERLTPEDLIYNRLPVENNNDNKIISSNL